MKSEEDGKSCGNIVEINDQTAQHYFILKLADKEIIIPIIKVWILEVNREENLSKCNCQKVWWMFS